MKKSKILLILSILFLIMFLIVLFNINTLKTVDNSVNLISASNQNSTLITISKAIAWIFEPIIVIIYALIISLLLFIKKYKKDSAIFSISMLAGGASIYIIKEIFQRARPINALVQESSSSFPSGHALISLIFLGFFIYFSLNNLKSKTYKIIISISLIIFILFIGISRLILNVHWLSDVAGGWLLGLFILLALVSIKQQ